MDGYWSDARVLNEGEYEAYAEAWKQNQPVIKQLQGQFGDPIKPDGDKGKPTLEIPILQMSWQGFLDKVKDERMSTYKHTAQRRVEVIERVLQLFRKGLDFHQLDRGDRQKIAGICGTQEEIDYGFFGSMIGAGKFKNVVNEKPQLLSSALDLIPISGHLTRNDYLAFVQEYKRGFPTGGAGLATATRLLAMKRPDVFVCLDKFNRRNLCEAFKIKPYSVTFEVYWDSIITRVLKSRWWRSPQPLSNADRMEQTIWMARTAFLDSLFYDPETTEQPE